MLSFFLKTKSLLMPAKEENCKERLKDGGKAALVFKETRSNLVIFICCMDYSLVSFSSYLFSELTELLL